MSEVLDNLDVLVKRRIHINFIQGRNADFESSSVFHIQTSAGKIAYTDSNEARCFVDCDKYKSRRKKIERPWQLKACSICSVEDIKPSNATNRNAIDVEAHITQFYVIGMKETEEVNYHQPTSEYRVLLVRDANTPSAGHHKAFFLVLHFTGITTKSINNIQRM